MSMQGEAVRTAPQGSGALTVPAGMGRVTVIGNTKGGVGKSDTTINMAVMLALAGKRAKIFDVDRQRTVGDWSDLRISRGILPRIPVEHRFLLIKDQREAGVKGKALISEIRQAAEEYDEVLVDVGGEDNPALRFAMLACDQMFVPIGPSSADTFALANLEEVFRLIAGTGHNPDLALRLFPCRVSPQTNEREKIRGIADDYPDFEMLSQAIVYERAQHRRAFDLGLGLVEMPRPDPNARTELVRLYRAIFGEDWMRTVR